MIIRTFEKSWSDSRGGLKIAIPTGSTIIERWGYDYATAIDVHEAPDGTIVADCQGRECSGWEARHHRIRVANRETWAAFKRETGSDREARLPNTKPEAREWAFVDLDRATEAVR